MQCSGAIRHKAPFKRHHSPSHQLSSWIQRIPTRQQKGHACHSWAMKSFRTCSGKIPFSWRSAYNNAKMQWPYSGENMLETVWYDPVCLYCGSGGRGAWCVQEAAHLPQLSCWLLTHSSSNTTAHIRIWTELSWAGKRGFAFHLCLCFLPFHLLICNR